MSKFTGLEEKTSEELDERSKEIWVILAERLSEKNLRNVAEMLEIEHELGMRGE